MVPKTVHLSILEMVKKLFKIKLQQFKIWSLSFTKKKVPKTVFSGSQLGCFFFQKKIRKNCKTSKFENKTSSGTKTLYEQVIQVLEKKIKNSQKE